jgi:hypothetical protein
MRQASSPERAESLSRMEAGFAVDWLKKIFCVQRIHTEIATHVEDRRSDAGLHRVVCEGEAAAIAVGYSEPPENPDFQLS